MNGSAFARVLLIGALALRVHRRAIDAANVFPVADADTGTNMYVTLRAAALAACAARTVDLQLTMAAAARAALLGARGNSGTILAALLDGFSSGVRGLAAADASAIARALRAADAAARQALVDPLEGTMLSVASAAARAASDAAARNADITSFLAAVAQAAHDAVDRTPAQLPLLAHAGVVDAGAAGLAYVFGAPKRDLAQAKNLTSAAPSVGRELCIQCIVEGVTRTAREVRTLLEACGDSIVVAGAPPTLNIHVHTGDAEAVRAIAASCGTIASFIIDDMRQQHAAIVAAPPRKRTTARRTIAVITDSTSDVDPEQAAALGITVVPLFVVWGNRRYRDYVDISRNDFYKRLASDRELPSTSQPTPAMFEEAFAAALDRAEDVLCVTISAKLSGTINAAHAAKQRFPKRRIEIVDSRTVSGGLAMLVERARKMVADGASMDEILVALDRVRNAQRLYACVRDLSYARRGGRIGAVQATLGTLLNVVPVLTIEGGAIEPIARVRSFERARARMLDLTMQNAPVPARSRYCIMHVNAPQLAVETTHALERRFGAPPQSLTTLEVGPAIAVHGGPGAVGIFSASLPPSLKAKLAT